MESNPLGSGVATKRVLLVLTATCGDNVLIPAPESVGGLEDPATKKQFKLVQ